MIKITTFRDKFQLSCHINDKIFHHFHRCSSGHKLQRKADNGINHSTIIPLTTRRKSHAGRNEELCTFLYSDGGQRDEWVDSASAG